MFEDICQGLMDLYLHKLSPLVNFITQRMPNPLDDTHLYVRNYFLPLEAMKGLRRLGGTNVSWWCVFGIRIDFSKELIHFFAGG